MRRRLIYAIFMVLTYMVGFNLVAAFNVADSFKAFSFYTPGTTPLIIGLILAGFFALCIMGGGKKISDVCSVLVPIMGGLYIATALMCLCSGVSPSADAAGMAYVQAALQNVFGSTGPDATHPGRCFFCLCG